MRWDNLRLDEPLDTGVGEDLFTAGRRDRALPLIERGAVARTFDTPGFRGMTFYEVQAKSVVNRVPEASRMPFRWTINPYRGCQHACTYCAVGRDAHPDGERPDETARRGTRRRRDLRHRQAWLLPPLRDHHGAGALVYGQARLPGHPGGWHPTHLQRGSSLPDRARLEACNRDRVRSVAAPAS